jgi:hypothetical protein
MLLQYFPLACILLRLTLAFARFPIRRCFRHLEKDTLSTLLFGDTGSESGLAHT